MLGVRVGGDAAELVKRINHCDFPAAVKYLADLSGVIPPSRGAAVRPPPAPVASQARQPAARATVWLALGRSIDPRGRGHCLPLGTWRGNALAYLRGRGLTDETIRAAGLGFTPAVLIPTRAGDRCFRFSGIVIPWRDGTRLTRIKIRRIDDGKPKYAEAYSDRPLIYPDPAVIRPGKPLIVSEGEFDCHAAGPATSRGERHHPGIGSARTDPAVLSRMLSSPRWFIALDADQAGDSAASKFPASAIRVRPPDPDKDWGEVHAGGSNRIRYHWGRYLPMSKSWGELESQRWGPSLDGDESPGAAP